MCVLGGAAWLASHHQLDSGGPAGVTVLAALSSGRQFRPSQLSLTVGALAIGGVPSRTVLT